MKPLSMTLRRQKGVALLEVLIAALLLAIGLLGTIGLQARAYSALSDAGLRAEATLATEKLIGIMSNDNANLDDYALAGGATPGVKLTDWVAQTKQVIPGATIVITVKAAAAVPGKVADITINWSRKAGDPVSTHHVTSYIATAS